MSTENMEAEAFIVLCERLQNAPPKERSSASAQILMFLDLYPELTKHQDVADIQKDVIRHLNNSDYQVVFGRQPHPNPDVEAICQEHIKSIKKNEKTIHH